MDYQECKGHSIMEGILITGGLGYIGSHVVWSLIDNGYYPVIVDDLSTGYRGNIPDALAVEIGDVGHKIWLDSLFKKYKITTVIHLAAKTSPSESLDKPLFYYQQNTINTLTLLRSMVENGVKQLIFSSTAAVYQTQASGLIHEKSPVSPLNPYGHSKLMAEQMIKNVAQTHQLNALIFRYFNVAGADKWLRTGNTQKDANSLIKRLTMNLLNHCPEITLFGHDYPTPDGTCLRDYVHVSDVAQAHVQGLSFLLAQKKQCAEVINVGYGHAFSVSEIIDTVEFITGTSIRRDYAPRREGDIIRSVADNQKIQRLLHWEPRYARDLPGILRSELAWNKHFHFNEILPQAVHY